MSRETVVLRFDDLDKAAGERTVVEDDTRPAFLSLDGRTVELDLSAAHRKQLEEALAPYFAAGAPVASPVTYSTKMSREDAAELRRWADARGLSYKTDNGGTYYPVALRRQFAEFKAGGGSA